MRIYSEVSLANFNFWAGAKETVKYLTLNDLEVIEQILEDCHPDGIDETTINDFFWFEKDTIGEWLGYSSFDELMEERGE